MEEDIIDTSDLVCYLAAKATEECYATKRAKTSRGLEPTTFKQALKHP